MAQSNRSLGAMNLPKLRDLISIKRHDYLAEAFFVLVCGFCVYAYMALFSFNPFDSSLISAAYPKKTPLNLAGAWGAYFSSAAIFYLGVYAFAAPLVLFLVFRNSLRVSDTSLRLQRNFGLVLLFVSSMVLVTKLWSKIYFSGIAFPTGGKMGQAINESITQALGAGGSVIAMLTLCLFSVMLIVQRRILKSAYDQTLAYVKDLLRSSSDDAPAKKEEEPEAKLVAPPIISERSREAILNEPAIGPEIDKRPGAEAKQPMLIADDDEDFDDDISPDRSDDEEQDDSPAVQPDYNYTPPPVEIFRTSASFGPLSTLQKREFEQTAKVLTTTFEDFGISGSVVAIQPGPVVTVFEFQPDAGTKLAKINSLVDDLALALKVDSIIMHPVRGKRAVGIQVPNSEREMVCLGDILQSKEFSEASSPLTLALGKSLSGEPVCADLTKMPHLLTAGATGSGKSVAINALLCSVIMKSSPKQVRMILVDPKMLELSIYEGVPHLLMPVITEPGRAAIALKWATQEMERRYRLMQHAKVRNILGFNEFCRTADKEAIDDCKRLTQEDAIHELPYILIVIDELADLMMTAPKDVESLIQRLAQKARASGIHLVLATQRPSVDIITGVIKANLPCRAAFQVVSKHDSRTILDQIGADKLLGNGDMLFQKPGSSRLERIQGAFISDEEVVNMVDSVKENSRLDYDETVMQWIDDEVQRSTESTARSNLEPMDDDPKWDEALQIAQSQGAISASYLQRQLKIGYNRAARIVETMEAQGLVARADGAKPRKWLGPNAAS